MILGRQASPWDVAFDRTADFLLSNFSSHEIGWWTPIVTLKLHLHGLEHFMRTCPVISYQIEDQQVNYRTSGCGGIPKLELKCDAIKGVTKVSMYVSICDLQLPHGEEFFIFCSVKYIQQHDTLTYVKRLDMPRLRLGKKQTVF